MIFVNTAALCQQKALKVNAAKPFPLSLAKQAGIPSTIFTDRQVIPQKFYVNNLGFFCKQELKFESATGIPFKFRLGSVQYCDKMEGKTNMGIVPQH